MIKVSRLPKEYTEVEYIQNSGTQYIDTGFIPNYDKNIKVEIETTPTVTGCRYCLLSNYSSSNNLSLELNNSNKGRVYWNNGRVDKALGTLSTSDKNTYIFEYDTTNKKYNFIVNNEIIDGDMNASGVSYNSLLMFVDREKRFSTFSTPLQIYRVRIWEDDVLIKDLIPCIRKADDEVGMYDLTNETFLTNAGTGTFTAGNQVKVKKIKTKINETMKNIYYITTKVNNVMVKVFSALSIRDTGTNITLNETANLKFIQPPLPRGNSEQDTAILPTGYTQLDYIESTGTQYIDTGFKPTQNTTKVVVDGTYLTADMNYFAGLVKSGIYYGVRPANVSGALDWHNATSSIRIYYTYLNVRLNYKYDGYKFYINDDLKVDFSTGSDTHFDINLYLFARNNSGTADAKSQFRMYSCKIYDNNTLVRDYIPCKNASNEIGLYDLVTKTFFGNSGTGTFTAGDVATLPTPKYPTPINNVTGDVEVLVQNKNLAWNGWAEDFVTRINDSSLASIVTKDGKRCLKFDRTAGYGDYDNKYLLKANWKENTQYTISCNLFVEGSGSYANIQIRYTDGTTSDHRYDRTENNWKNYTLISTENKTIKDIAIIYLAGVNYIDIDTFMVEQGTTATTYTPHKEQTYTFPLGTQRMYLGDYLADDGIHHVRKQTEITAENVDTIVSSFNNTTYSVPYIMIDKQRLGWKINWSSGISLINNYSAITSTSQIKSGTYASNFIQQYILIFDDRFTDLATAKQLLIGTIIEIQQANEWIEPYTTEQQQAYDEIKQAISYEEQTNISGSSDESNPLFSVEAYQSIKLVLAG